MMAALTAGLAFLLAPNTASAQAPVGSEACSSCHSAEYSAWGQSTHAEAAPASVECEDCHGPAGNHVADPDVEPPPRDIDSDDCTLPYPRTQPGWSNCAAAACEDCHGDPATPNIPASDGFIDFIDDDWQTNEFLAGPHGDRLTCRTCHDSHSSRYRVTKSLTWDCTLCHQPPVEEQVPQYTTGCEVCHPNEAEVFSGSRKEQMGFECQTCHMPLATKSGEPQGPYKGDVKTHLFSINPDPDASMFTPEGDSVQLGGNNKGAVTIDFTCLRCHQNRDRQWAASYAEDAPGDPPAGGQPRAHSLEDGVLPDPGGGPHGGYDPATAACAACHRAHTAVGIPLIVEESSEALCLSCHDGSFATTDVMHGVWQGTGERLNGGGFELMNAVAATSTHGPGEGTAWGGANSGAGVMGTLTCTSCHNPHGSTNYRILRDSQDGYPYEDGDCGDVPGCAAAAHRWIPDDPELLDWKDAQVVPTSEDNHNYAAGDNAYYTGVLITGEDGDGQLSDPELGMSAFCSTCHKQYLTRSGSGRVPSDDAGFHLYAGTQDAEDEKGDVARYRHEVQRTFEETPDRPLRFAASGELVGGEPVYASPSTYDSVTCLTCHFAHGTSAQMTAYAEEIAPTNDSALLYYDNRGVCRACHQIDK